jgi:hypothetical protein
MAIPGEKKTSLPVDKGNEEKRKKLVDSCPIMGSGASAGGLENSGSPAAVKVSGDGGTEFTITFGGPKT